MRISWEKIDDHDRLEARYFFIITWVATEAIPLTLLPDLGSTSVEKMEAIGTLLAYSFVTQRQSLPDGSEAQTQETLIQTFDMHLLVHLVTQILIEKEGFMVGCIGLTLAWTHSILPD